jgi:hypothetical protein
MARPVLLLFTRVSLVSYKLPRAVCVLLHSRDGTQLETNEFGLLIAIYFAFRVVNMTPVFVVWLPVSVSSTTLSAAPKRRFPDPSTIG